MDRPGKRAWIRGLGTQRVYDAPGSCFRSGDCCEPLANDDDDDDYKCMHPFTAQYGT
jgi:hypothetical protein